MILQDLQSVALCNPSVAQRILQQQGHSRGTARFYIDGVRRQWAMRAIRIINRKHGAKGV